MGIQAGLVGLPNVGKSTLFNALTKSSIPAENYPFCTIDPHVAITEVPDDRMLKLLKLYDSKKLIPGTVTFVDIAGLVKGAAAGEGLGNQFLSNIRECDLILHVLRCYEDPNIIHTSATIDPVSDYEIIMAELMLKDLESIVKRLEKVEKSIKVASTPIEKKTYEQERELLKAANTALESGDAETVRQLIKEAPVATIPLLSAKNFLIIANIAESELEGDAFTSNPYYKALVAHFGEHRVVPVSAKIEYELSRLSDEEAADMMSMFGLTESGLQKVIRATYEHLGMITFFTCGPKEIHAWPIRQGTTIKKAAGEIHTDLERGFICAEIFNYNDLIAAGSLSALKATGKIRTEGADYIVQDGDLVLVRFAV